MMLMVVQKGHGIPDSLLKEIKSVAHNFFDIPNEEKVKIKISPAAGYRFASWDNILYMCIVNEHQFYFMIMTRVRRIHIDCKYFF